MTALNVRIATCNVATTEGRMAEVLGMLDAHAIDMCALQETRVSKDALPAAQLACKRAGYKWLQGAETRDRVGRCTNGVAIVARWPVEQVKNPPELDARRFVLASLHRPQRRPLLCIAAYLSASNLRQREADAHALMHYMAECREDVVVLGDFNMTVREQPLGGFIANGTVRELDDWAAAPLRGTRATGRQIDYGLFRGDVTPSGRCQIQGPADHDCVMYDLELQGEVTGKRVWPKRRQLDLSLDDAEVERRYLAEWRDRAEAYRVALKASDVDLAWRLLSDAAEEALSAENGSGDRRSKVLQPRLTALVSTKAEAYQSLQERQVRRLHRQLVEWSMRPTEALKSAIGRKIRVLSESFPALRVGTASWQEVGFEEIVRQLVNDLAEQSKKLGVQQWKERMATDLAAKTRWIMREAVATTVEVGEEPHPQLQAAKFRRSLAALWGTSLPQPVAWPAEVLQWTADAASRCSLPVLSAKALLAVAKKSCGKAAGTDGWRADALIKLPKSFWEDVAALWNVVLNTARIPQPWLMVRTVGIPKVGGVRPLGVEELMWRCGMTVITKALSNWAVSWAPPGIVGAIQGRTPEELHEKLSVDLDGASREQEWLVGCKLDLRKAFDTVDTHMVNDLLSKLGAPRCVLDLVEAFDSQHMRYVEVAGAVHPEPIMPARSLPQGDPLSPLRLSVLMAAWGAMMTARWPQTRWNVYLDDRLVWCRGPRAVDVLAGVLEENRRFEESCGLEDNAAKRELFGTTPAARRSLQDTFPEGKVVSRMKVLGVMYSFTKRCNTCDVVGAIGKAERRCRRIAIAGGPLAQRRVLVKSLVLSLFAWVGGWNAITKSACRSLNGLIECALLPRRVPGRNRYLFWSVVGPDAAVDYCFVESALRLALWRVLARIRGLEVRDAFESERLKEVLTKLGWRVEADGKHIVTDEGILELGADSWKTVCWAARRAWLRTVAADDAFLGQPAQRRVWTGMELATSTHVAMASGSFTDTSAMTTFRCLVAAPLSAGRMAGIRGRSKEQELCICGAVATAEHLTFDCPLAVCRPERPTNEIERRLLLRVLPRPAPRLRRAVDTDQVDEIAAAIGRAPVAIDILIATDGGAVQHPRLVAGSSWAVAVLLGDSVASACGLVQGLDCTPYLAEAWALLHGILALKGSGKHSATILVDNESVVKMFAVMRGARGAFVPHEAPLVWQEVLRAARGLDLRVVWIPSHGKQSDWIAPRGWPESVCRYLNEVADGLCTKKLEQHRRRHAALASQYVKAGGWTRSAITALRAGVLAYLHFHRDDV
jgi:ribonuclease HI